MTQIITIIGARPQFIKAAAVSRVLRSQVGLNELLIHTGQHYDSEMSQIFFNELEIPEPDYHLGIGSNSHGAQTGRMLEGIERVLLSEQPDWVLVYGDTNSTLAGALAAVKLHLPVVHVEAGLRSFNRRMPEEINRVLTDQASTVLFAPTETAVQNLVMEGIPQQRIHLVGDVMYDAVLYYGERAERKSQILESMTLESKGYVLATLHRAENTDVPSPLRAIFEALKEVAQEIPVVLPLHPRTRDALERERILERVTPNLKILKPLGYFDMIKLEKNARLIVTDSGGVQKEAFFYGVPCVTLRKETEWVELVECGWNRLVPPLSVSCVVSTILESLSRKWPATRKNLYGSGNAADLIADIVIRGEW